MERIRIGNDISIDWSITRNGAPESLAGRDITIEACEKSGTSIPLNYTIEGNVIHIAILGKDQKRIGIYALYLTENKGLPGMTSLDDVDAFALVPHTNMEGGDGCSNVKVNRVQISSDVAQAKSGLSAYELDVAAGNFSGTLEQWLVWIKKPAIDAAAKVDEAIKQMDGKVLIKSTNDINI